MQIRPVPSSSGSTCMDLNAQGQNKYKMQHKQKDSVPPWHDHILGVYGYGTATGSQEQFRFCTSIPYVHIYINIYIMYTCNIEVIPAGT